MLDQGHVLVEVTYSLISPGTEISSVQSANQSLISKVLDQPDRIKKLLGHLRSQGIQKTIAKVQGQTGQLTPLGYSCSGVVTQVGEGVTEFQPGDQVACAGAGIANHAEMVLVPRNLVVKIPDGCDLRSAASVTLGAIALQGVRRAEPRLGEIVVVIGLGLLGQLTTQILKAAGCRVIGIDVDARRVALAKTLGADAALNPSEVAIINETLHLTAGYGADATIITAASNSDEIVQQAMEITRKKGRVVVVGAVGLGLKRSPFYEKEIDFLISTSYGPGRYDERYEKQGLDYPYSYVRWTENRNMQEYLRLVAAGKLRLDKILEREYSLEEAPQAYSDLQNVSDKPLGVILRYPVSSDSAQFAEKMQTRVSLTSRSTIGKIRIAVVGAGSFAKAVHLPNLQKLSDLYSIRAIVSGTGTNAKSTAEQFGAAYASTNYQDVLNDPDVDAVMICTRHNLHAQQAILAAKAGKAIFLEKPMALNQEELDQLVEVLKETGVPFMVGYNRRYSPAARRIKEIVKERQNPLMILYRMNAGYLPPTHWTQTEEGGGRIIGEACHIIDLFQYLIGTRVEEMTATALAPKSEHVLASDNMLITLRYSDGSVASLFYTSLGASDLPKEYMEIYVDGKVLLLNDYVSLEMTGIKLPGWSASIQDKGHLDALSVFSQRFVDARIYQSLEELAETSSLTFEAVQLSTRTS
ncbi:MAG: oxidoreductase [Chloroflexota bacterium]|nr:MAG: oxidoreductase [Chloroflexota bacterium]